MNFIQIILLASLIVLIAHMVKGLTGFGSSLIIVPLLSLFLDIKFVVPVMAVLTLFASILLFLKTKKHINKEFLLVLIFVIIGSFIGVKILASYNSLILKKLFGIIVILFAIHMLITSNKTAKKAIKKFWGAIAGIIAGILGGMFDTNGPPLVIYFSRKLKKQAFRATLTVIFFIDVIWRNLLYLNNNILTLESFKFSLYLLPALIIGLILGSKIHLEINEILFKKAVAGILLVTGILLVL